jgi:hypothetical protein
MGKESSAERAGSMGVSTLMVILALGWLEFREPGPSSLLNTPVLQHLKIGLLLVQQAGIWWLFAFYVFGVSRGKEVEGGFFLRFLFSSIAFMWIQIVSYTEIFRLTGLKSDFELNGKDYLYFSIITWTTVGYGDIIPSPETRLYAGIEALSGYVFMGIFISMLGAGLLRVTRIDAEVLQDEESNESNEEASI